MAGEKTLQDAVKKLIGSIPENLILRTNVGLFYTKDGREVFIGKPGQSDLIGLIGKQRCPFCGVAIHHKAYMLETKAKTNQSENQKKFEDIVCIPRGIEYRIIKSLDDLIPVMSNGYEDE